MKKLLIPILLIAALISCEKSKDDSEKGQLLFYTNSALINCPFEIDLSLNGKKIGTINATTIYSDTNWICEDPSGIGLLLNLGKGIYNYSANEVKCTATNRINSWAGTVNVTKDSCTVIFLDIFL